MQEQQVSFSKRPISTVFGRQQQDLSLSKGEARTFKTEVSSLGIGTEKTEPCFLFQHYMSCHSLPASCLRTCVAAFAAAAPNSVHAVMPRVSSLISSQCSTSASIHKRRNPGPWAPSWRASLQRKSNWHQPLFYHLKAYGY